MLYNNEGISQKITNDKDRKRLYDEVITLLNCKIKLLKYIKKELDSYFHHYESQGDFDKRVKVGYLFNGSWQDKDIQEIYEILRVKLKYKENIAFEKAKEVLGCLVREVMINDNDYDYLGEYIPEKGYNYKRELIY